MTLRQNLISLFRQANRTAFGWVKERFPTVPWADLTRKLVETDQRQVPRSHAEKYELKTIWYWYPLYCLGGISFVAFILLTITGIVLGFYYVPDGRVAYTSTGKLTNPAYDSMLFIMNSVPFGFVVRGLHHWSAHIMIAAVFLQLDHRRPPSLPDPGIRIHGLSPPREQPERRGGDNRD